MRKLMHFMIILSVFCVFFGFSVNADTPKGVSDPEKSIVVTASQPEFTIRLASNPTTGYSWFIKRYNKSFLSIQKHQFLPPTSQIVGAGGVDLWVFKVNPEAFVAPHIFKIKLVYARPWEVDKDNKEIEFTIVTSQ